jgi:hypothetical protein
MQEAGLPQTEEEAYERVRASPSSSEGYAFLGIPIKEYSDYLRWKDNMSTLYKILK